MREQERCSSELVSLPSTSLPASDGTILPLNQREQEELSNHIRSSNSSKSNLCRGCPQAEGPRKIHRTIGDIDRATHTLHIFQAFRYSLMSDCLLLAVLSKFAMHLSTWLPSLNPLQSEGFTITDSSRVSLHSDRAGEFTAPYFEPFLTSHKIFYNTTVGLVKSLAAGGWSPCYCSTRLLLLVLLCLICCSVFTVSCTSTTSTVFTFWFFGGCSGARAQEDQVSGLIHGYWSSALLGSHARLSVIHPLSSRRRQH